MSEDIVTYNLSLTRDLRKRVDKVAKRRRWTASHLIRVAIENEVSRLEAADREQDAHAFAAKETRAAAHGRRPGGIAPLSSSLDSSLAPVATNAPIGPKIKADRVGERIFQRARDIAAAGNDISEARRRLKIAVDAIKQEFPLSSPEESVLISLLEGAVVRLRGEVEPPGREYDERVGGELDLSHLRADDEG